MIYDSFIACVACTTHLQADQDGYICKNGHRFPLRDGKIYFTQPPDDYEHPDATATPDPRTWSAWRAHNFEYFDRHLADLPSRSVLADIGTGPGQFQKAFDRIDTFIGIDFRPYEPVSLVADLTGRLPLRDGAVDIVTASNTLEHIPDTEAMLGEIARVLKPGGTFIATIPFLMRLHQKPYDYNRYTNFQLDRLLVRAGFVDIVIEPLSKPHEVYATIERQFYGYMIDGMRRKGKFHEIAAKLLWKLVSIERKMLAPVFRVTKPTLDYTEGYGVRAVKTA
jgi:ubiquinone/menaquinone biosynthesis C-methylase UbiE